MTETANLVADGSGIVRRVRTGVIVLAVPDLEEPYFAELTALLVRRAEERGLSVIIRQTDSSHAREVDVADGVGMPLNDGLIHIPRALTVADLTRRASAHLLTSPSTTAPPGWRRPNTSLSGVAARWPWLADGSPHRLTRPTAGTAGTATRWRRTGSTSSPGWSGQSPRSRPQRGSGRWARSSTAVWSSTASSARTTRSPSVCCRPCRGVACGCPTTSRLSGWTTSSTAATRRRRSQPCRRTRTSWSSEPSPFLSGRSRPRQQPISRSSRWRSGSRSSNATARGARQSRQRAESAVSVGATAATRRAVTCLRSSATSRSASPSSITRVSTASRSAIVVRLTVPHLL
jgi:hypothetical protein